MRVIGRQLALVFSEPVTVKGKPRVKMSGSGVADYVSGSGTDTLLFGLASDSGGEARTLDLNGGAIAACEASAALRPADLSLRVPQRLRRDLTSRFAEILCRLHVTPRPASDVVLFVKTELTSDFCGRTEDERARWNFHSQRDEGVGTDN